MDYIVCAEINTQLRCALTDSATDMFVPAGDVSQFSIAPDAYVILTIEYLGVTEDVIYSGATIVNGKIPVVRSTGARAFPIGATVTAGITCAFLQAFICQEVARCGGGTSGGVNNLLTTDNIWRGVNQFLLPLTIGQTVFDPVDEPTTKLLKVSSGLRVGFTGSLATPMYGFLSTVIRQSGANTTYGGTFEAKNEASATGEVIGVSAIAWTEAGNLSPSSAVQATVYQETSNSSARKVGITATFRNRPIGVSSPALGLGANKYNDNSVAYAIESSGRGSAGEFCGFNVGIEFKAGSLDATSAKKAVGVDFSKVPDAELSRYEAGVRLRHGLGIEFNADAGTYASVKLLYKRANKTLQFNSGSDFRFGVSSDNGRLAFSDSNAGTPLVVPTAGVATGTFLPVEINGVVYKLQLLAA